MMGNSKCFVFGCKTGYASDIKRRKAEGKKNLSLFSPPQNEECFQKWKRSVPRSDKELSRADKVCELHFLPEEISRHYIHKMPDGSIKMLEKGKINLLTGAVPTVFPNLPAYRSKDIKKRKPPAKRQRVESVECNTVDDTVAQFPIHNLIESLCDVQKPNKYWSVSSHEDFVVCAKWDANFAPERQIIINADLGVKIMYYGTMVSTGLNLTGSTAHSLSQLLAEVEKCQPCSGAKEGNKNCSVFIEREWGVCGRPQVWCSMCKIQKAKPKNPIKPKNPVLATKYKRLYQRIVSANRKNARLREKIALLKQQIELVRKECSLLEHKSILKSIAHLPEVQRCNIEACLNASKVKSLKGVRYTNRWVYECLLMRIKSRKLYEHLRENKILALPTIKTLGSYIKHIKGSYGFESKIFECLERKASFMDLSERRGVLLIDEMQLSPSLAFDKQTLEVNGFTNLGRYTPKHQASQKGDHALVLMYQPFKGKWIQSVAAFLSKGAASGSVLHHIVIEAVALLEKSGFYVDAITTDGASWNRKMWLEFGISEENVSCAHVCDPDRRLWFLSDFPHLIKNLRNFITEKKFILTPDGPVKTSFWDAIIEHDNPRSHSLKICPKLKPDHISPKFFQKMNVAMAFQFFSESVASGMEALKDTNAKLRDSEGCIVFVKRLNKLIDNMNSRTPYDALKLNSLAEQEIKDFINYLAEWQRIAGNNHFMTRNTYIGLKVTLTATLEILSFLATKHNFKFLMTARLNQDSLEKFFGIMRSASGSNDHPDPTVFLQLFRLIGTYSLIKPPKGSNIEGIELFKTLLQKVEEKQESPQENLSRMIDHILGRGGDPDDIGEHQEHIYNFIHSSDMVVSYVTGFVARRLSSKTKCESCKMSLLEDDVAMKNRDRLINIKSKGYLFKASDELFNLISQVEECVLHTISTQVLNVNTMNDILENLEAKALPLIGCPEHALPLTNTTLQYYLVLRMCFICRKENEIDAEKIRKRQAHRKLSKLS